MGRGVGASPDSGKIEAELVPLKYLLLILANFKFSYLPTTLSITYVFHYIQVLHDTMICEGKTTISYIAYNEV